MKRKVVVNPRARIDMRDIWRQSAERWSLGQAEVYARGLRDLFDLLAEHPEIARERLGLSPPLRMHPYQVHIVIFEVTDEKLDILRVVHGRTNWRETLGD